MHATRLILIDGLMGAGKSTTAQWLCRLLTAVRGPAVWVHEQDIDHPIYSYGEPYAVSCAGAEACEAYHAQARARWAALAAHVASRPEIMILESSYLQTPVASMLMACCDAAAIASHVADVERHVRDLDPVLIHLAPRDSRATLDELRERRTDAFIGYLVDLVRQTPYGRARDSVDGHVLQTLLEEQERCQRHLVESSALRSIAVPIAYTREAWDESRAAIAAFLDLPPHALEAPIDGTVDDPDALAGSYRDAASDQRIEIAVQHDGLVLRPSGTRLLARGDDTFDLEGLCVQLTFERHAGRAERIHCAARMVDFGTLWVRDQHDG